MNTDRNQRPSGPDEPLAGSGPDRITPDTPVCPTKNVQCNYWTKDGCHVAVCWMQAKEKEPMTENQTKPKGIIATPDLGIITPEKTIDLEGAVALELFFQVKDKDGQIREERTELGHSFVANFIKLLYCSMMMHPAPTVDGATLQLVDTGGIARTGGNSALGGGLGQPFMRANAGVGSTSWGVLVGTDDGTILPKDINNYALGAQIAHGTGSGQLSYGDHSIVPVTHDGATYSYAGITRSFSNGSGAAIDVKEIGLATNFYWDTTTYRYFLLSRDILGTPVTVPNGQALTASIRIKCYC